MALAAQSASAAGDAVPAAAPPVAPAASAASGGAAPHGAPPAGGQGVPPGEGALRWFGRLRPPAWEDGLSSGGGGLCCRSLWWSWVRAGEDFPLATAASP